MAVNISISEEVLKDFLCLDWLKAHCKSLFLKEDLEQVKQNFSEFEYHTFKNEEELKNFLSRNPLFKKFLGREKCSRDVIIEKVNEKVLVLIILRQKEKIELLMLGKNCGEIEKTKSVISITDIIESVNRNIELDKRFAVFSIDIENFGKVNGMFGIEAGDKVLEEVERRLKEAIKDESCSLARFYSDKFIAICSRNEEENNLSFIKKISSKILQVFKEPILIDGEKLYLVANIGVALYPEHGENVLTKAEIAQREAFKRQVPLLIFSKQLEESTKSLRILARIKEDLKEDRITIFLQPKVELSTGKIIGAEALMRCSVPPGEAIPVITEYGLLFDVGEVILERALSVIRRLEHLNLSMPISVNISYSQLIDKRFLPLVENLLKKYRINPGNLIFEMTETEATKSSEEVLETLQEIKKLGIKLSIDDFGTGYSSLSRLKLLNADEIKIDKSFVLNVDRFEEDKSIVKFIIEVGKILSMDVVAEGVERRSQIEILRDLGCNKGQGFYYYPPLPINDFFKTVESPAL